VGCARRQCVRQRALEIDPQSPEVHNLLGYTAQLSGETDEALEHYRQAISLDETYLEAMLNAAEVLMHPLEDWNEALKFVDDALEYAETPEEVADCVLLKVTLFWAKGRSDGQARDGDDSRRPFEGRTTCFSSAARTTSSATSTRRRRCSRRP